MMTKRECTYCVPVFAVLLAVLLGGACLTGGQTAWAGTQYNWAWMKGANTGGNFGSYGTMGTAAAENTPGAREGSVTWTDALGALWLFGGGGFDAGTMVGGLNDLWKYDRTTGNWTWMKGSNVARQMGTRGTLLTPAAENTPGGRYYAVSWMDASGALWLFGGKGTDGAGYEVMYNDLWKFTPSTGNWTWMKGASTVNQAGTYGTQGTPAAENTPGARVYAVSWIDAAGALWLFGGEGRDSHGDSKYLNDLWKYDPATGNWTWMKGADTGFQDATYGTQGEPDAANTPSARAYSVSWTDTSGGLWLFGGYDGMGNLNDLWKYDLSTGYWTWMKGSTGWDEQSVFGTQGTPAAENSPAGRMLATASWVDASGALWLFGGYGRDSTWKMNYSNDMWKYDPATTYWTWMKGANTSLQSGIYGTRGTPAAVNTPGARNSAVSWTDPSGALWLFGGTGLDSVGTATDLNDLWRLDVADTTAPTGTIVINNNQTATKTVNVALALGWDDGVGSGVTRMRFSNDGSTWTAWEALKHTRAYALPAGDGYKTVRVQYLDIAGNKSAVFNDFIRLDTVPPTGGILINNGATTTTALKVTLKLNWADVGSGVTRMRFSDNGSTWSAWTSQRATYAYTLPAGLGYHTVRVQFTDAATNYSPIYNDYIKVVAP